MKDVLGRFASNKFYFFRIPFISFSDISVISKFAPSDNKKPFFNVVIHIDRVYLYMNINLLAFQSKLRMRQIYVFKTFIRYGKNIIMKHVFYCQNQKLRLFVRLNINFCATFSLPVFILFCKYCLTMIL
ncbi:MAG: hypothetical protein DWB59_08145 [Anaerolineae bacterium]|nr:hypothetical protein [Anaerolineae bacterium]